MSCQYAELLFVTTCRAAKKSFSLKDPEKYEFRPKQAGI
ncbi:hypothetical protein OROGR_022390 [Orobanche gracilis]